MADQISDAVLDAIIAQDPNARVACETVVKTGFVLLAGEISTTAKVDYEQIVRYVSNMLPFICIKRSQSTCCVLLGSLVQCSRASSSLDVA